MESLGDVSFGPFDAGALWLGTRVVDDRCPEFGQVVIAADLQSDSQADTWTRVTCRGYCDPTLRGATDLNGDTSAEVFVVVQLSSTPAHRVYTIVGDGEIRAVTVGAVGHPEGGFDPGEQAILTTGDDEGFSAAVWCTGFPDDTVIEVAWSDYVIETDSPTKALHRTSFTLDDSGVLQLVARSDTAVPIDS